MDPKLLLVYKMFDVSVNTRLPSFFRIKTSNSYCGIFLPVDFRFGKYREILLFFLILPDLVFLYDNCYVLVFLVFLQSITAIYSDV